MTISYNWLVDYLPELKGTTKPDPETLSKILTDIGLEVEGLEKHEQVPGGLNGLVIGQIKTVEKHPNADRLKLTSVDVGEEETLQIVCGAPNVEVNQMVVVAPVGVTIYPLNGAPFKIKKAKIRKVASFGMMCAEDEIGLGESHEGIIDLNGGGQPGMPAAQYYDLKADWIYEIGLTPNRMDAMSHLGVARDVCAKLSHDTQKEWIVNPDPVNTFSPDKKEAPVKVTIENNRACARYAGVTLSNLNITESPEWIQERLRAVGVRPINNIVDITNYVLHECGQPLHAFDLHAVKGRHIQVKNLKEGTPFVTLDEETRKLRAEDLMICNEEDPMCIAGVFGGLHSGVTENTTSIFLESACFDAVSVRRTSFYHGLRTDAATRFEKGVDISGVLYALKRAALLMKQYAGAEITSEIVDCYPQPKSKTEIVLKKAYLAKLSGKSYSLQQIISILGHLGFEVLHQSEAEIKVAVPFSKPDMSVAADLVEEIMRIDGFDAVEAPSYIRLSPSAKNSTAPFESQKEQIASYLTDNGFYEILTNSITNSAYYEEGTSLVKLLNNLTVELDVLRPSLLETGLEVVAYNLNRKQENIRFFETGKVYAAENDKETQVLGLWLSGDIRYENWIQKTRVVDPYFVKGHLKNLLTRLGISTGALSFIPKEELSLDKSLDVVIGKTSVGRMGSVSKGRLKAFDIKKEVWYAEIELPALNKFISKKGIAFKAVPKFPDVRRDLALILNKKVDFAAVEKVTREVKTHILAEVKLFDVFEGEKLGADKKSYAVSFVFRHPEKTLTDKEIDKVMQKLIRTFEKQLGAEIRS